MLNMYTRAYIKCPYVARDFKATDLVVRTNHDKCVLCNKWTIQHALFPSSKTNVTNGKIISLEDSNPTTKKPSL